MDSIQDGRHARAASNAGAALPYFCQWESAHLAGAIIRGELDLRDDPAWAGSGAADVDEYARWASHVCGMACLKMVLAARTGRVHPTLALARASLPYGAYTVDGDEIKGMIYAPFVRYVEDAYGLRARVHVDLNGRAAGLAGRGRVLHGVGASVDPLADQSPPKKGGHLVLVTRASADEIVFHIHQANRRSTAGPAQADARLAPAVFDRYFAGRGVAILRG